MYNFIIENKLERAIIDYNEKWDVQTAKVIRKSEFESKLISYFQTTVKLFLPNDILQLCETPN